MRGRIPGRDEESIQWILDLWRPNLAGPILELGPGNGQLEPRVRGAGGTWHPVDKDPRALPKPDWACYPTLLDYEQQPSRLPGGPFCGIFCRNSIAASWLNLPVLAQEIHLRMSANTWAWISLWCGDATFEQIEGAVKIFERYGFESDREYIRDAQVLVTRCL